MPVVRWLAYGPAVLWAAFLLYIGQLEFGPGSSGWVPPDKLVHGVLYWILGGLLAAGRRRAGARPGPGLLLLAGALVGLVDEWSQQFVPTRSSDPLDWIADLAGVLTGFLLVAALGRRRAGP